MRRKRKKKKSRRSKRTRGSFLGPVLLEMVGIIGLLLLVSSRDSLVESELRNIEPENSVSLIDFFEPVIDTMMNRL